MLIEPASKVSVPFTVVIRMRSKVPDKVMLPAPEEAEPPSFFEFKVPNQTFPVRLTKQITPVLKSEADV